MERRDEGARNATSQTMRRAAEPFAPSVLWSAIRAERRAVEVRTSTGAARCGWLDEARR